MRVRNILHGVAADALQTQETFSTNPRNSPLSPTTRMPVADFLSSSSGGGASAWRANRCARPRAPPEKPRMWWRTSSGTTPIRRCRVSYLHQPLWLCRRRGGLTHPAHWALAPCSFHFLLLALAVFVPERESSFPGPCLSETEHKQP